MSYLALYRKYRPRDFDHVVGQEYVTRILRNQILSDRVGHAYLFTGIRGTGKTSIAKIFARAINCLDNTDGNPCNQCRNCTEIEKPGVMDIIEIDAASNRGVDEIRDIRDKVNYPPKIGTYKVYIIDEVHMLTKEAFNALLKTLEEPPEHVVFILATTEPNRLPATILSRCQRFDIRPISQEMIAGQMQMILDELDIAMEPEAVGCIAHRADHSMRDGLSILDQIIDIRQGDAVITTEAVIDFLGMTDADTLNRLVSAMLAGDAPEALALLDQLRRKGIDSLLLMGQIIDSLRQMAIVKAAGKEAPAILGLGEGEVQSLVEGCADIPVQRIFAMIDSLIEDRQKLRFNDLSATILEMSVLKQCMGTQWPQAQPAMPAPAASAVTVAPKRAPSGSSPSAQPTTARPAAASQTQRREAAPAAPESETASVQEKPAPEPHAAAPQKTEAPQTTGAPKAEGGRPDTDAIYKAMHRALSPIYRAMLLKGRLRDAGHGNLILEFQGSEGEAAAGLLKDQTALLEKTACSVSGKTMTLEIRSVQKNYEDMSMVEKTIAIVGDEKKIVLKED
jgi:DNA polymerase-3 subunit gamma/tau